MAQMRTSHRARISPIWCKDPLHRPSPGVRICPLSPRTDPAIESNAYVKPFHSQTNTRGRGNASSRPHPWLPAPEVITTCALPLQPQYAPISHCVHAHRKEPSIPASPEANRLLVAFETYHRTVKKGELSPLVDELGKEIHRGLEQLALTQQVIRMIASAGLSPWSFRKVREIERDLEQIA